MTTDANRKKEVKDTPPGMTQISKERLAEFQKTELEVTLKKELFQWGKNKFWLLTAGLTIFGILGGGALITTSMSLLVEKKAETKLKPLVDMAYTATRQTIAAEESLKISVHNFETLSLRITEQIGEMDKQLERIRSGAASNEVDNLETIRKIDELKQNFNGRLSHLEIFLSKFSEKDETTSIPSGYAENSKYNIVIYANNQTSDLASLVATTLQEKGYRASILNMQTHIDKLESIINSPIQMDVSGLMEQLEALPNKNTIRYRKELQGKVTEIINEFREINMIPEIVTFDSLMDDPTNRIEIYVINP